MQDPLVRDLLALTERTDVIHVLGGPAGAGAAAARHAARRPRRARCRGRPADAPAQPDGRADAVPRGSLPPHDRQGDPVARPPRSWSPRVRSRDSTSPRACSSRRATPSSSRSRRSSARSRCSARAQARLLGVPTDHDGMRTDVLEALLARQRPKLIYTLPTFQNPSGAVLEPRAPTAPARAGATASRCRCSRTTPTTSCATKARRSRSLTRARPARLRDLPALVLEGALPGAARSAGWPRRGRWRASSPWRSRSSTCTPRPLGQLLIDRLIRGGHYARHLAGASRVPRAGATLMDEALAEEAPCRRDLDGGRRAGSTSGAACRTAIRQSQLLARAAEQPASRTCRATPASPTSRGANYLRLNFTFPPPAQIRDGVARLMGALRRPAAGRTPACTTGKRRRPSFDVIDRRGPRERGAARRLAWQSDSRSGWTR